MRSVRLTERLCLFPTSDIDLVLNVLIRSYSSFLNQSREVRKVCFVSLEVFQGIKFFTLLADFLGLHSKCRERIG